MNEEIPDILKLLDYLHVLAQIILIILDLQFSSLQGHTPFLNQVVDQMKVIDILPRKIPGSLLIPFRLEDSKFLFPVSNGRSRKVKHFCNFPDRVEHFFDIRFFVWQSYLEIRLNQSKACPVNLEYSIIR